MPRSALVTGGAGFIGSHVVEALLARGWGVQVVDNLSTGVRAYLPPGVPVHLLDVLETARLESLMAGCDAVVHLAAVASVGRSLSEPLTVHRINAEGTLSVLEAARRAGVKAVVFASSAAVYAPSRRPRPEGGRLAPTSLYGATKLAGERLLEVYASLHGMRSVSLRFFNVYGPRQRPDLPDASVIPRWMACLWRRVPAELYGSGRTARDFVFVDDAARAAADAVEAALAGTARGAINVGSGEAVRLEVLWHLMTEVAGRPGVLRRAPPRPGDLPYSRAEVGRARQLLGFAPGISLSEGLRRTWSWWAAGGVEASPSVPAPEPARVEAGGRPRSTMAARDPGTARPPRRGRGAGGRGSRP